MKDRYCDKSSPVCPAPTAREALGRTFQSENRAAHEHLLDRRTKRKKREARRRGWEEEERKK